MLTKDLARVLFSEHLDGSGVDKINVEIGKIQSGHELLAADHELSPLQGDVIDDVLFADLLGPSIQQKPITVLLVANTCDMAPENKRSYPLGVSIAPVMSLVNFESMLNGAGLSADRVAAVVADIKAQRVSNLFYLPEFGGVGPSLALLDKVQSRSRNFIEAGTRRSVLTTRGHWCLLLKLAGHFCRSNEGVERQAA